MEDAGWGALQRVLRGEIDVDAALEDMQREAERVLGARNVRAVAAAWDDQGRDVTRRVRERDEVYADGWAASPYQGVAAAPWTFSFDPVLHRGRS